MRGKVEREEREGRKDDNRNIQWDLRDYFSEREISPVKNTEPGR